MKKNVIETLEKVIKHLEDNFKCKIEELNCKFEVFVQTWSNTGCGLEEEGDICGQAFTEAYTVVCKLKHYYIVYFNGEFAYAVRTNNESFLKDLRDRQLASKLEAHKRY